MRRSRYTQRSRRKRIIAASVLGVVFLLAALLQLWREPHGPSFVATASTQPPKERAVFGGESSRTRARAVSSIPPEILDFLEQWRSTMVGGDLQKHVSLYAPVVDRFFRERNVSREAVRQEKKRMLDRYPHFDQYDLRDVKVDFAGDNRALVTFRKDWSARGVRRFAGSELQRLTLQKDSAAWQIVSEEELRVFWVRR